MNRSSAIRFLCVSTITFLGAAGCVSRPSPIPSGVYSSRSTRERVTVTPTELALDLRIPHDDRTAHVTKVVSYTVHPDFRIWTWGYGSAEFASTFGRFDWYWTGSHIVRYSGFRPHAEPTHFYPEL